MVSKEPIWTKSFISLFCTNFSIFIIFYGLVTVLPLYVTDVLNRSDEEAGLLMTIFLISAIIVRPFTGTLLELVGKRKMLWISLLLYLVCTILYYFIEPFSILLVLRFIQGIWFSIATTASGALAADTVPITRRGAGLGYFTMATNLAVVVGPMIALSLIQNFSYDVFFIAMSVIVVIGSITALGIPKDQEKAKSPIKRKFTWNDLFEKKAVTISLIAGCVAFSYSSILSYLTIYSQEKDVLYLTSTFFAVFAIVMLLTRPFTGRIFDERGPKYIILPGLFFLMIGFVLLAFMDGPVLFLISGAFIGLGYGAVVPSFQTIALQSSSHERSGYATATFFTLFDTGIALGSFVLGIVAAKFGYQNLYLLASTIVLITLIVFLIKSRTPRVA